MVPANFASDRNTLVSGVNPGQTSSQRLLPTYTLVIAQLVVNRADPEKTSSPNA